MHNHGLRTYYMNIVVVCIPLSGSRIVIRTSETLSVLYGEKCVGIGFGSVAFSGCLSQVDF